MGKSTEKKVTQSAASISKSSKLQKKVPSVVWNFPFTKKNLTWIGIGFGVIILGYILMATGITEEPAVPDGKWNNFFAIDVAPFLLVVGYCVILPYAILKIFREKSEDKA